MNSDCIETGCSTTTSESPDAICPICGSKGSLVDVITLKALLTSDAFRRGLPPDSRYCANPHCAVVYFDNAPAVAFRESDLIVPVHAKHPDDETIPVCYCFGYTGKLIREETERTGASTATPSIAAEVTAGHCACELRNPKGSCCLGDIAKVERRIASVLTLTSP